MKDTSKIASPAGLNKVVENAEVTKLLLNSSKGFTNALSQVTSAATLAAKEFSTDNKLSAMQKVDSVIATYAPTFAKCDANVKKHFANCLWLLVTPDAMLETKAPTDKQGPVTEKASSIVATAGKALIQTLAKEARAANGAGRKVTPKATPKKANFIDLLTAAMQDIDQLPKIKLCLMSLGYALTPIEKTNTKAVKESLSHIVPAPNSILTQLHA